MEGRETFLTTVNWTADGWPVLNEGKPILLSESFGHAPDQKYPPEAFVDSFNSSELDISWYQLRVPYTENYGLHGHGPSNQHFATTSARQNSASGITFSPNVFGLSDRDVPAAILRKQKSLNMTFSATLLPAVGSLGPLQTVGISVYLSEFSHQDIGVTGCANTTGLCIYSSLLLNGTTLVRSSFLLLFS